jgi:hypothetical protein
MQGPGRFRGIGKAAFGDIVEGKSGGIATTWRCEINTAACFRRPGEGRDP